MKLPWPIGALELWLGLIALALGILAVLTTLGGMAGGYTGAVQGFLRLQLLVVALQVVSLFGLVGIMSTQHRTLRRAARSAALLAARRHSDQAQSQVLTAAANLAAAAGAVNELIVHQREMSMALSALADRVGVEVVLPVPPPGVSRD